MKLSTFSKERSNSIKDQGKIKDKIETMLDFLMSSENEKLDLEENYINILSSSDEEDNEEEKENFDEFLNTFNFNKFKNEDLFNKNIQNDQTINTTINENYEEKIRSNENKSLTMKFQNNNNNMSLFNKNLINNISNINNCNSNNNNLRRKGNSKTFINNESEKHKSLFSNLNNNFNNLYNGQTNMNNSPILIFDEEINNYIMQPIFQDINQININQNMQNQMMQNISQNIIAQNIQQNQIQQISQNIQNQMSQNINSNNINNNNINININNNNLQIIPTNLNQKIQQNNFNLNNNNINNFNITTNLNNNINNNNNCLMLNQNLNQNFVNRSYLAKKTISFPIKYENKSFFYNQNNNSNSNSNNNNINKNLTNNLNNNQQQLYNLKMTRLNNQNLKRFNTTEIKNNQLINYQNELFLNNLENNLQKISYIDLNTYNIIKPKLLYIIKTQIGSKILQNYLQNTPSIIIHNIFIDIYEKLNTLLLDPYANYFCLKLFSYLNNNDRINFLNIISQNIYLYCTNKISTYTIQYIISNLNNNNEKNIIITEINKNLMKLSLDVYGTHVLEKIILCFEHNLCQEIINFVIDNFLLLSNHVNGLCIVKKILTIKLNTNEYEKLKNLLLINAKNLIENPYGNYALQIVIDNWTENDFNIIFQQFYGNYSEYCIMKYSSNVIEKCIQKSYIFLKNLINETCNEKNNIGLLIKNSYGNYVIQTALKYAKGELKLNLINSIEKNLNVLEDKKKLLNKWKNIINSNLIELNNNNL